MPDQPSAIGGVLRRPFPEQVAYFRQKLGKLVPTARWDDLIGAEHDTAFMVAGAQKADLLADLAAAVDRAVVEGKSLDAFRQDFAAAVERNDWHGWTGEDTKAGRAWRTRTIYRTNASVSYAAGRRAQLQAADWKYWIYRHGGSKDPRPEHLAWDGLVLLATDPAWSWLYPPSDWGCSCYVVGANTLAQARRLGGDPDKARPADFGAIDPRTGAPIGVGKGWDYAPGASVARAVSAAAAKIGSWDHQIAKAFTDDLPDALLDALAQAYRRLPSVADDTRRYAQRVAARREAVRIEDARTLGLLTDGERARVAELLGTGVDGYDLTISRSAIDHVLKNHGEGGERDASQRPVTTDDFGRLAEILRAPDAIEKGETTGTGRPAIVYRKVIDGEEYHAVFELLGKKRRALTLKTFFVKRAKREPPASRP